MNLPAQTGTGGGGGVGENQPLVAAPPDAQQQQQQEQSQAGSPSGQTNNHQHQQHHRHQHPTGPPQRQLSIPVPNALLNTVNANKQRQPMCPECEKSLPNQIVFDKIESIIRKMQEEQNGLPVKTAKSFMTKIPSVFTGTDLIAWMMRNLRLEDQQEAMHLANLIASHGYIFPIEDHTLTIKNDATFYRFQTPYLWPSNNMDPENTDYAVYLCKRTMQGKARLELADYEAENLARLQKMFSRKWDFIFMQAESQAKVDKKRDKLERKVLDSQERAFWDVYRPVPGCVNTTELDIKKACRLSKSAKRCGECQKVAPVVAAVATSLAGSSSLLAGPHQPPAPSPSPEVAQMKGDQQVHRLSFRQTTPTKQQQQQQPQRQPLEPRENHQPPPAVQHQPATLAPSEPQQVAAAKREEESVTNSGPENAPEDGEPKKENDDDDDRKRTAEPPTHPGLGEVETSEPAKSEQQSVSNSNSNSQAGSSSDQKQVQSKQASNSHHHHSHPHHHHHHQHHHHHHHPHSHAHHAHHHHHHHHHRSCPHHHAKQQQQQAQAQAHAHMGGDGPSAQESSGTSSGSNRCQGRCSMRSKQRSSGSVDQLMGPPAPANSRRKSECNRMLSMSENPVAQKSTKDQAENQSGLKQQQRSILKPKAAGLADRPASACALSSSTSASTSTGAGAGDKSEPEQVATATSGDNRTSTQETGQPSKSSVPPVHLQRKSSLNIVRPPSADHAAAHESGRGAADLTLAPAGARKGSVSSAAQQRAQLKGAASICTPPSALIQAGGSSQDLHPIGAPAGGGLVRAGSATGRRELGTARPATSTMTDLERELESLRIRLDRGGVKMSKVTQSYLSYFNQWAEYDPFIAQPLPSNPWQSDSTELWDSERQTKDVHCRRVRRWAFSLKELLNDPAGREQFHRFLEKEFSAENLKFWDAVQELKRVAARDVSRRVEAIWTEYLAQDANCPINIDSKSYETSKRNMAKNKNNRYIFDEAAGHVYQLMKNDSYPRYLRSDMYKDYKEASERRRPNQVAFDVFKPQITTLKHKFNF